MRKSLYLALTLCAASFGLSQITGTAFGKALLAAGGGTGRSGGATPTPAEPSVFGLLTGSVLAIGGWPLSALATGLRFAAGAATTTTRRASPFPFL